MAAVRDKKYLTAVWRDTLRRLEGDGGKIVPEPGDGGEADTMFWHSAEIMDSDGGRHRGWVLLEHPPGEDPGRPDEMLAKVGPQWRCLRCMKDRMWAKFEAFRYRLDAPCPRDGHRERQFAQ